MTHSPHLSGLRSDILDRLRAGDMDDYRDLSLIYADALEDEGDSRSAARRRRKAGTMRPPGLLWPDPWLIPGLTPHQAGEAAVALSRRVGLLAGTPGTGKTWTTARIVAQLMIRGHARQTAICAPTGKAAVRISGAILSTGNSIRASTVHQLLEIGRNGHDGEGWGFRRNANNYLDCRFLIVEEASMLDTGLAASLLAACRPGTHVLFVGDPHQLPPVGHGAPLRDMIAAGLPCGRLTEIRRNAGMIVEACARIKDGLRFDTATLDDSAHDPLNAVARNLVLVEADTPDDQAEHLRRLVASAIPELQVVCGLNGGGAVGRAALNAMLQDLLNPGSGDYRSGDKVICLKNGPYPVVSGDCERGTAYVANGEMGVVRHAGARSCEVDFPDPARRVIVHAGKGTTPDDDGTRDAGDSPQAGRQDFALGYAITGHKSQGSEWPVVAVMLDGSRGAERVCSREWLYTAVSRASRLCVLIGSRKTLARMLARTELAKRRTRLVSLIGEARKRKPGGAL